MQANALAVDGLTKRYRDFELSDISFSVPRGSIVGLVGENGAGKTTTINAILGLIGRDGGDIEILGRRNGQIDAGVRAQTGVVFDGNNFPDALTAREINNIYKKIYAAWDEKRYFSLLEKMDLTQNKKIKAFSKGMKVKLSIAVALSHDAKLLILDEPTGGLDPVMRDDMLDMFLDFVQDEDRSILLSSHVTSDLEKIADHIVFIHKGKLIFNKPKDELRYKYGIIRCGAAQFDAIDRTQVIAWRKQDYQWNILAPDRMAAQKTYPDAVVDPASIDEIMLMYIKGERA